VRINSPETKTDLNEPLCVRKLQAKKREESVAKNRLFGKKVPKKS